MTAPALPPTTVAVLSVEEARAAYLSLGWEMEWGTRVHLTENATGNAARCRGCLKGSLDAERLSLAYDLAASQQHGPYGGPTPLQLGEPEDGAALALRMGIAW